MSQNDLTSARLRELIAAARCNASYCAYCGQPDGHAAQALADYLDGNASALADAQDKADLLEWLVAHPGGWYLAMSSMRRGEELIDALRAAKEASRGNH